MKNLSKIISGCLGFFFSSALTLDAYQAAQQLYSPIFLEGADGLSLEKQKNYASALARYRAALEILEKLQAEDPDWEKNLVVKAIKDTKEKIVELEPLAAAQVLSMMKNPISSGTPISILYEEGVHREQAGDHLGALNQFQEYLAKLEIIHRGDPQWEMSIVEDKIEQSKRDVDRQGTFVVKDFLKQFENRHGEQTFQ